MNKKPGVCYAFTPDGIELPVIDVTHPAFAVKLDEAEQQALTAKFMAQTMPFHWLPPILREPLMGLMMRGSVLAQGMRQSRGSFFPGITTYQLKLGPDMLGAWAKPVDRRVAAAFPLLCMRVRLQNMAELIAEALAPALAADAQAPVCILDIAGGPSADALNALILLVKRPGNLLANRAVRIEVLDPDTAGPAFAQAALQALRAEGAPLAGVDANLCHRPYRWSQPRNLTAVLRGRAAGALTVAGSEGGLFEYGSDDDILGNLRALRQAGGVAAVAGTVTRADGPTMKLRGQYAATRPRGLAVFTALAAQAGWSVRQARERPFSDHVLLE